MLLADLPAFDVRDFQRRWAAARAAALRAVLDPEVAGDESALLSAVPEERRDDALRAVFDASRALGRSAARHHQVSLEPSDFAQLLAETGGPCFRGEWKPTAQALRLERSGCSTSLGGFLCDFWREAADGLVMGAGDEARLARHQSFGHGDAGCVDVLFEDGPVRKAGARFAPVPEHVQLRLEPVVRLFEQLGAQLTFEGLNEGVLHYRLESKDPLCGDTGRVARERLAREVQNRFPGLALQDSSPLAVYAEGTQAP